MEVNLYHLLTLHPAFSIVIVYSLLTTLCPDLMAVRLRSEGMERILCKIIKGLLTKLDSLISAYLGSRHSLETVGVHLGSKARLWWVIWDWTSDTCLMLFLLLLGGEAGGCV